VLLDGSESALLLQDWVLQSYNLVLAGMPKRRVAELGLAPLPRRAI
jgi:predicted DNA-binding protein (MmcQ/YjbR family)